MSGDQLDKLFKDHRLPRLSARLKRFMNKHVKLPQAPVSTEEHPTDGNKRTDPSTDSSHK